MLAMVLWIWHLQHEQLKKQANKNKQVGLYSLVDKEFAWMQKTLIWILGWEDPLEEG